MPPSVSGRDVYPNILGHLEFKFILVLQIFIWQLQVHFLDQMPANSSLKTKANLFLYRGLCCNVATFLSVLSSAALMLQWQSWIVVTRGCVVHTMVTIWPSTARSNGRLGLQSFPSPCVNKAKVSRNPRGLLTCSGWSQDQQYRNRVGEGSLHTRPSQHEKGWRGRLNPTPVLLTSVWRLTLTLSFS